MDEKTCRFLPAWDPVLRFLHWWNAAAMTAMAATGIVFMVCGPEIPEGTEYALISIHASVGFLFGAGVLARILWLFMGTETARWTDMLPISAHHRKVFVDTVRFYLRGFRGETPLYLAHNSFAGPIYLGFFILAAVQVASGSSMLGLPEEIRSKSMAQEVHATVFLLLLLYIIAHLAAVFIHEIAEKRGIVSAMIHGKKTFTDDERDYILEAHPLAQKGDFDERKD